MIFGPFGSVPFGFSSVRSVFAPGVRVWTALQTTLSVAPSQRKSEPLPLFAGPGAPRRRAPCE
eukprot:12064918-Alexandrium_andersonii.AAC.1